MRESGDNDSKRAYVRANEKISEQVFVPGENPAQYGDGNHPRQHQRQGNLKKSPQRPVTVQIGSLFQFARSVSEKNHHQPGR